MQDTHDAVHFPLLHAASLLSQSARIDKFGRVLERVIGSDSYVVDIGTGTGILAMLAARAGARRVTALDVNAESIRYAREAARLNGLGERIEFMHRHFADFYPNERADVVICEMLSSMMLVEQQVPACRHAVEHVLSETGVMVPREATVYCVPVEHGYVTKRFHAAGLMFPPLPQTVDYGSARDLADLRLLARFDFQDPHTLGRVDGLLEFDIIEDGIVHGIVGLFTAVLDGDLRLEMEDGWREIFLPLRDPLQVHAGDTIHVSISYEPGRLDTLALEVDPA